MVEPGTDLIVQMLAGGGSSAQIVMAAILWRMRDDIRSILSSQRRHANVLRKMIVGKPATLEELDETQ